MKQLTACRLRNLPQSNWTEVLICRGQMARPVSVVRSVAYPIGPLPCRHPTPDSHSRPAKSGKSVATAVCDWHKFEAVPSRENRSHIVPLFSLSLRGPLFWVAPKKGNQKERPSWWVPSKRWPCRARPRGRHARNLPHGCAVGRTFPHLVMFHFKKTRAAF